MSSETASLTDQQRIEMARGLAALWALVFKYRATLERLLSFNREINAYLTLQDHEEWFDFQEVIAFFEPKLIEASLFLVELDRIEADEESRFGDDLVSYGKKIAMEITSETVTTLAVKFSKEEKIHHEAYLKQQTEFEHSRFMSLMEERDKKLRIDNLTRSGFIEHGNGTVTDSRLHLMWMQCAQGQTGMACEGTALAYTWDAAMLIAPHLNQRPNDPQGLGYADWRLPSVEELQSLVVKDERPTICSEAFPNAPASMFWSSTLVEEGGNEAWNVYFGTGSMGTNDRENGYAVRLVRTVL